MHDPMSQDLLEHTLRDIQNDVKEIVLQTKKTNGRVSELENWKAYITGGMAVLLMLVVPIFLAILSGWLDTGG